MKKIIIVLVSCFICNPMFASALSDAIKKLEESGTGQECRELKNKIKDLNNQLKVVEAEYETKCVIDGTGDVDTQTDSEYDASEPTEVKCDDGSVPDINGCCTDEIYTDMGREGFNCCPKNGGECFPPIKINTQK